MRLVEIETRIMARISRAEAGSSGFRMGLVDARG